VDLGAHDSQNSFDTAAGKLADYLEVGLLSPAAQFLHICRTPDPTAPRLPCIRTFGMTRISDSDLAAVEKRARQLVDPTTPPERQLAAARRRAIDQFLSERLEATHPTLLSGSVARRFLIATSRELQRAGFAGLVQHHLPATASAVTQADEGITILCECENLTPVGVAWRIAQNRPDLFSLAPRLVTRSDVAWVPL
jgi:hypothetical protein